MLNSDDVHNHFMDCLFDDEEPRDKYVPVEGITVNIAFHPERLESKRSFIKACVAELNADFTEGGGMTFLNLCEDKNGNQWTSFHRVMEELVLMSIGLNEAHFCLPKDMWSVLPGGMPYVCFKPREEGVSEKTN